MSATGIGWRLKIQKKGGEGMRNAKQEVKQKTNQKRKQARKQNTNRAESPGLFGIRYIMPFLRPYGRKTIVMLFLGFLSSLADVFVYYPPR